MNLKQLKQLAKAMPQPTDGENSRWLFLDNRAMLDDLDMKGSLADNLVAEKIEVLV